MDQPYIRDQNITVEELVKQSGNSGENIQVRRFALASVLEGKAGVILAEEVAQMGSINPRQMTLPDFEISTSAWLTCLLLVAIPKYGSTNVNPYKSANSESVRQWQEQLSELRKILRWRRR